MRSFIAGAMAVLGIVLVLCGAAALWAAALVRPRGTGAATTDVGFGARTESRGDSPLERALERMGRFPAPDRMITWGVVLLALSAVAVGAISFSATATAGTR